MPYIMHHVIAAFCFFTAYVLFKIDLRPDIVLASVTAVSIGMLLIGEWLMPEKKGVNVFRDPQTRNDLYHFITYGLVRKYVIGGSALALVILSPEGLLGLWPSHTPYLLQFIILLFLWETVSYWRHRLQHTVNYLWPMHAVHHDTPQMHTFKAVRVHFLDDIFSFACEMSVPFLFGGPVEVYLGVLVWNVVFGNITHSNMRQKNPRPLHYVLPTLQLHTWHHSEKGMCTNMAGVLPPIDMLFGTYTHPDDYTQSKLGLGTYIMPKSFLGQLWHPIRLLVPIPR